MNKQGCKCRPLLASCGANFRQRLRKNNNNNNKVTFRLRGTSWLAGKTLTILAMYLPMIQQLATKLGLENWVLDLVIEWVPREVARGAEMASGILLPIFCYTFMPAYRKFCNGPDPDDLKLSKPRGEPIELNNFKSPRIPSNSQKCERA